MSKKTEAAFKEDDFVVYPTHGVGRILGTETREISGSEIELLVVRFEHDRMTLRVPMEKARSLGLRTLSSKKQMEQAITTLQGKARVRRTMWSRRAQEYETKIKSGDPSPSPRSCVIFIAAPTSPNNPIPSARCIRPLSSDWPANLRPSRRSTRKRLRPSSRI